MMMTLDDIGLLFRQRGHEQYSGEAVSQLEHALQCASLAEAEGASDALVTAAWLHDLGHLLHDLGDTPSLRGVDDLHQYRALPQLRGLFGPEVLAPIALHVAAKRYLCSTRAHYFAALSDDSKRSLALQGGPFSPAQCEHFLSQSGADDAVRLRIWDDSAKTAGHPTPGLDHFIERARRCARV
ncbi:MAG: phosphohydrolase [Betaproteobacteria bacterium]|nr:HD domain-containing protein [Pseudomonadota bacterium]NBO12155.1 phosphohydrolase [Betaproteobacteria bacterium]NBO44004.1 phosphohydrolase [Betaproteobacteria bacterium]NBP10816.1 phosphohydrolase [Betaproteobacteria bacterium]NBP61463.1 phosphohydrolase [Betaproteobacteria bacterium]